MVLKVYLFDIVCIAFINFLILPNLYIFMESFLEFIY